MPAAAPARVLDHPVQHRGLHSADTKKGENKPEHRSISTTTKMQMTYIAQTVGDRIQLPPAIAEQIRNAGWVDVRISPAVDNESLTVFPLPHPGAPLGGVDTTLDAKDGLRVGDALRQQIGLTGQSVMVRFEADVLRIYLRQVFKTLGFRPA